MRVLIWIGRFEGPMLLLERNRIAESGESWARLRDSRDEEVRRLIEYWRATGPVAA